MQSFIAGLPASTRAKLALRRAQVAVSETSIVSEVVEAIRTGAICYQAAIEEFGLEPARALFDFAGLKVI